jgi:hypothetical protein
VDYSVTGTDDNTFVTFSGLACSATKGDVLCVTVWISALVTTATVNVVANAGYAGGVRYPYTTSRTTGTGAGTHGTAMHGMSLEYSGGVFYDIGITPAMTFASEGLDNDGTFRRLGNRLITPVPVTVDGFWAVMDNDTDTTVIKLYDTDGTTELATATLVSANRDANGVGLYYVPFAGAAVNLSANTANPYRVAITTNSTTANAVTVRSIVVSTAAELAQLSLGTGCYYTSHDGASWSDTTTRRVHIGLLASKFDDGSGVGRSAFQLGS